MDFLLLLDKKSLTMNINDVVRDTLGRIPWKVGVGFIRQGKNPNLYERVINQWYSFGF